jgi:hypothetical protein
MGELDALEIALHDPTWIPGIAKQVDVFVATAPHTPLREDVQRTDLPLDEEGLRLSCRQTTGGIKVADQAIGGTIRLVSYSVVQTVSTKYPPKPAASDTS